MSQLAPQAIKTLQVHTWIDFQPWLSGLDILSLNVGFDSAVYLLEGRRWDRHDEPVIEQDFFVIRSDGTACERFSIPRQSWFNRVQPLPHDEFLLTGSTNAKVFALDGTLKREFWLGDYISGLQATYDGRIWTSYWDEGIFKCSEQGLDDGVVVWNASGQRLSRLKPWSQGVKIWDAFALNVASDRETWCHCEPDFSFIYLRDQRIHTVWAYPERHKHYGHAIAVWESFVLVPDHRHTDQCHLYEFLPDQHMRWLTTYHLLNEVGKPLYVERYGSRAGRANYLYVIANTRCYRLDVRELVE
jgi:hypothetical protein